MPRASNAALKTKSGLAIEYLPLEALILHPRNARTHSESQVAQIAASIGEFGFTNPLLIGTDNTIIAGHGRLEAARLAGLDAVPCIRLAHLSPAQRCALLIADNKIAANAGWNMDLLRTQLEDLEGEGFDLALTGFSALEIDSFLGEPVEPDADAQWDGMPEYEHEDQESVRRIVVHFATMDDFHRFAKLIGQDLTDKIKSIWFPAAEIGVYADKRYAADELPGDGE